MDKATLQDIIATLETLKAQADSISAPRRDMLHYLLDMSGVEARYILNALGGNGPEIFRSR